MLNFLKKLLFGKHYEVKKRLREGTPMPRPQEEKDLQLKYFLEKLLIQEKSSWATEELERVTHEINQRKKCFDRSIKKS